MKTVVLSNAAARQLEALPHEAQEQITDALYRYAASGVGDVKSLLGRPGYRLRVGRYRVIFAADQTTILAVHIGKRETTTYSRN
jgi:mRNA interferase RelE/StbE